MFKNTKIQLIKRVPLERGRPSLRELKLLDIKINKNALYDLTSEDTRRKRENDQKALRWVESSPIPRKVPSKSVTPAQLREAIDDAAMYSLMQGKEVEPNISWDWIEQDTLATKSEQQLLKEAVKRATKAEGDQVLKPKSRRRKDLFEGWKRIPSMHDLDITLNDFNTVLDQIGFEKRLPNDFKFVGTRNENMNRFMIYELRRLKKCLAEGNNRKYWEICIHLLKKSVCFRVSAFNRVLPDWWHAFSWNHIKTIARQVNLIFQLDKTNLDYRRVYIPKGETWRPLGVPTTPWRVAMHMVNNFLVLFLRHKVDTWNHGFLPRRGTGTALKECIELGQKYKYIYEFDFNQFFPSVNIELVSFSLLEMGMPLAFMDWIRKINMTDPKLPQEEKLEESLLNFEDNPPEFVFNPFGTAWSFVRNKALLGLPQGLNTSPILSIFSIYRWVESLKTRGIKVSMYADDGHLYSEKPFKPYPPEGHSFNQNKSGWIKEGGPAKIFKYLGMDIDLDGDTISGNTRKGNKLEIKGKSENFYEMLKYFKLERYGWDFNQSKLKTLSTSGLWGYINSKLYSGSWEEVFYENKDWKQHNKSWWVIRNGKLYDILEKKPREHRKQSSIAVNALASLIKNGINRVGI